MSDIRQALEKIMRLCDESRTYSRRTQVINDTAMKALGMTANQRHAEHVRIMERVGDKPILEAYLQRREKAHRKMTQYFQDKGIPLPDDWEFVDKTKKGQA